MSTTTATDARAIPAIGHDEAMRITQVEFDRMLAAMRDLDAEDWARPTDNTEWNVREMLLHLLGAADANASMREMVSQVVRGKRLFGEIGGDHWVDGVNEIQIRDRATLTNAEVVERYTAVVPRAVRARRTLPAPLRALPILPMGEPFGRKPVGYLTDMGFTRDVWMHRADLARATGRPMEVSPEHDGRIVADVVREWAALYGLTFSLELDGPAGGTFVAGTGGESLHIDAVDFVRVLSGRGEATGLLAHPFPL
jgi:uncharacterized protein (TIGR03083 family)